MKTEFFNFFEDVRLTFIDLKEKEDLKKEQSDRFEEIIINLQKQVSLLQNNFEKTGK